VAATRSIQGKTWINAPVANMELRGTRNRRALTLVHTTAVVLLCAGAPAAAEPSIGQFELKTLESTPGGFEFQSQNAWSWKEPRRRIAGDADGAEFDENAAIRARHALELEMGFTKRLKMRVGVEFEKERLDEPETVHQANAFDDLELTELGAELIAVLVPRIGTGVGLGVVAELERPMDREEPNRVALGTVIEARSARWFLAATPLLVHAFGGDAPDGGRIDDKWDFAYAAQLAFSFSERWSLALEGYGTVERLGRTGHPSQAAVLFGDFNQHRLGPVLYYTHTFANRVAGESPGAELTSVSGERTGDAERATLAIGVGLLEGLNDDTADHTLKLSIEVDF